ncbi:hypothetical protein SAMN05444166_5693 [Singulisphaera sp. GP187]|uniref:helix-turn-helix transcriptional regulator n=1 Tax=Singulisphaera sp. GP187 TaxID=1882752 RepID=UPI000926B2B5|nr:DNA-binding protein [Singulisphaera sp. GP187]SIO58476.1 hypothetical protein SAMN05444166_5693 [Singulisphaera sp. GP187]
MSRRTNLANTIPAPTSALEPLLGVDDLADTLAVGRRTVERMRSAGKLPRPDLHIGRLPRWQAATIRGWLADQVGTN